MKITEQEMKVFVGKFFPGKELNYASDECIQIQAGNQFGIPMHYEYHLGTVALHLEQKDWRAIRNHLNANLHNERLTPSNWFGRNNCQWTIDGEIHTVQDMFQAFLDIRNIIEPVIEKFEGKEPQDYSHYSLGETKAQPTQSKTPLKKQEEINLTLLADKELVVIPDTNIANVQFISGFLCGGWMGTSVKPEVCQVKRNADELTVQMHLYADNYCKGVQLLLKQKGNEICGKIEWAKGTKRRAERNERIEKILQSDWNDTSDADVANLDTDIPIGKKGYGVEKIIVEIELREEVSKEAVKEQEAKAEANIKKEIKVANKIKGKESKTAVDKTETNQRITITPIDLPPVTIERKIDQLGITLSKTYDKLAEAPIQGVDALGRRTKDIQTLMHFPELKSLKKVQLTKHIPISGNKNEVAKKLFNSVQNTGRPSYDKSFWEYLAHNCDPSTFVVETGYELKSTFGVVSLIPTIKHSISAADETVESFQPTFCYDNKYFDSQITSEDIITLFTTENADEIKENEIIFSSPKFNNLHTVVGSYKTPKGFDNTCPECRGEKKIRCNQCEGSGREQYQEGNYADGRPKIKTGKCSKCYGFGFFVCKTCNETGKIDHGTGWLQIEETIADKLRLREKVVVSNTFFTKTNNIELDLFTICKTQRDIENKKEKNKKLRKKLIQELEENCNALLNLMKELKLATFFTYSVEEVPDEGEISATWINVTYYVKINGKYYDISTLDFSNPWHAEVLLYAWRYPKEEISYDYNDHGIGSTVQQLNNLDNDDCGVGSTLKQLKELENFDLSKEEKHLENLFSNLFSPENVEVIFKNQLDIAFDNQHRWIPCNISQDEMNFLYQQNLQKVQDVFKLDNPNERILGILEKHNITDTLLKINIPFESNNKFVVFYLEKENLLFYSGGLPEISTVKHQFEKEEKNEKKHLEEKRIREEQKRQERAKKEEQERQERARKKEEQRQAHYSQSMDTLLDKEPTKKIGLLSKLFKLESYKEAKDAEKAVKLMIYMAKADGVLDIDEKESLTSAILNTFSDAYTAENRQRFIDMLDSDSLPELTKDDVNFSTTKALNKAIKKMEEMAAIGGISPKEKELLERVRKLAGISK